MINTYEYETELLILAFLPMFVPGFHHGSKIWIISDNRTPWVLSCRKRPRRNFIGQAYIAPITAL